VLKYFSTTRGSFCLALFENDGKSFVLTSRCVQGITLRGIQ